MLSLMATILAELVGFATRILFVWQSSDLMRVVSSLMLLVAMVSGVATLIMTPIVLRTRRQPPPRPIVIVAIVAGVLPVLALVAQQLAA